jgi:Mg2+ and Co2+ transporter CorA
MEIKKKIETLNTREFFIMMSDRLTNEDWEMLREIKKEREELEKKLN